MEQTYNKVKISKQKNMQLHKKFTYQKRLAAINIAEEMYKIAENYTKR